MIVWLRAMAIASVPVDPGESEAALRERYDQARGRIEAMIARLGEAEGPRPLDLAAEPEGDPPFTSATARADAKITVDEELLKSIPDPEPDPEQPKAHDHSDETPRDPTPSPDEATDDEDP